MASSTRSASNNVTTSRRDSTPPQAPAIDPFSTPFDGDQSEHDEPEEEWWNEEDNTAANEEQTTTGSRLTQWPASDRLPIKHSAKSNRKSVHKNSQRYSVQKFTREKSKQRQKKQNMLAGIKVVTDFSKSRGSPPATQHAPNPAQVSRKAPQLGVGHFVDLAALQALESQAPSNDGWLWKSIMDMLPSKSEASTHVRQTSNNTTEHPAIERLSAGRGQEFMPTPLRIESALSPNDRPIVIGISIPSQNMDQHVVSPQTAVSETSKIIQSYGNRTPNDETPETPSIFITPAQNASIWSSLQQASGVSVSKPHTASSVYSRATNYGVPAALDAPPLPQMPAYAMKENQERAQNEQHAVRESSGTLFSDDVEWASPTRSRAMSSYTVFEEDESPILARKSRGRSVSMASKHASVAVDQDQRQSKGWWNIMTPFMSRSNTFASPQTSAQERPALPSLQTAVWKAQETWKDSKGEKTLSPETPFTSTTISSDAWWDKQSPSGPVPNPFRSTISEAFAAVSRHKSQKSEDEGRTLDFMLAASAHPDNDVQSGPLTRTMATPISALSPSDREAPFILAHSNSQQEPRVQKNFSRRNPSSRARLIDIFPQPPRPVARPLSIQPDSPQPPPYSPPRPAIPRYRAVLPPGHPRYQSNLQEPPEPGPLSPGLHQAMALRGGIALSEVPSTTPGPRRPIRLNSAYPGLPVNPRSGRAITASDLGITSEKSRKAEAKRRRYEREDAVAHKAGGLWRGRGCIPKRGCYGRQGAEGRKRRRVWFGLIAGFVTMIILIIVLATTLHRKPAQTNFQSQWLNLTGFPPIFTGISTVAAPDNSVTKTGCVFPATIWSCALPKEEQQSVAPDQPNQPNFRFDIQWDNSTTANLTFANVTGNPGLPVRSLGGNSLSARQFIKRLLLGRQFNGFAPSPPAPSFAEQFFLGNTTDGIVSNNKAGEPTPFYITFMTSNSILSLSKRAATNSNVFPDIADFIPPPDSNPDGTAAPANLLPFPFQQSLRLFDRGLDTEHYGFYTYFNRSIFLKSTTPLNSSNLGDGTVPDDENGGCTEAEAKVRCTWAETRFLVQMWTRKASSAALLSNSTSITTSELSYPSANTTANNFTQPGSFPYPVTITTDRHGGDPTKKLVYCYALDDREHNIVGSGKVQIEQRFFGGVTINPAPSTFSNTSDPSLGGFDGGTGGCSCQWQNWQSVIKS